MRKHRSRFYLCQRYQHLGSSSILSANQLESNYSMQPELLIQNISSFGTDSVHEEISSRLMHDMFQKNKF